jgi:tRNA-specific adenosine deaminase 2
MQVSVNRLDHPIHPPYHATGGFLREEAIMILRRFYITENTNGMKLSSQNLRQLTSF